MNPIVRKATLDDLPILLEFEQGVIETERPMNPALKDGHINYYDIEKLITDVSSEVFVVELNGEIVSSGYVQIKANSDFMKYDRQGYMGFMFVPPQHRGQGLNKLILDALTQWSREQGVVELRLDVYASNPPAIRAYEKAGFEPLMMNMRKIISLEDN